MRTIFIQIVFFLIGFSGLAQSSNEKVIATASKKVSLDKKMGFKVLSVYQDYTKTKVEDLFSYFQLLTDASLSDDVKNEVIKNIQQLFKNDAVLVVDLTSDSFDKIPLEQFVQKLLISEPILFQVSDEAKYNSITYQSWNTNYTVTRTKSGLTSKIKLNQTIYLLDEVKEFGSNSKNTMGMYLGEMN
jgi:hypothetical protein